MRAKKYILGAILAFAVLAIPATYAEDYVILTPSGASTYYNADFNQTAIYINTTLSPNATIVQFGTIDETARSAVASKNPKYIYLVVQPANLSPDFLNNVDNLTKWLDSDPYVDAGWSIITGYDNTSAKDLFDRNMDASWSNNYVFVPFSSASTVAQVAAGNQIASMFSGMTNKSGASATSSSIYSALALPPVSDFVYFAGNATEYASGSVKLYAGDNAACPAADSNGMGGCSAGMDVQNIFFFADTSDAARVNGSNPDSTWLLENSPASYNVSLPVAFSHSTGAYNDKSAAYLGPHSTRWATSENVAKLFVSSLGQGTDIISALRFAKNALVFNERSESITSNFTRFVEEEYNLFGKAHKPSPSPASALYSLSYSRSHSQNPVLYSNNITNITWNATIGVSTTGMGALYDSSGWKQSGAAAWYRYVNSTLSSSKVAMSFVAALAGEIKPDKSALQVTAYSGTAQAQNLTAFNITAGRTSTDYIASESLQNAPALKYDNDTDRIYFARLYSPNESLSSGSVAALNVTYITDGIITNRTSISGEENVLHEGFDLKNPTDATVSGASLFYYLPHNVTTSCSVSGANCTIIASEIATYANVSPLTVQSGTNPVTINYNTTLDVNTTLANNYLAYNRGETISVASNVTAPNYTVLDYNVRLVGPAGNIVWSNSTDDIAVSGGVLNLTSHTYAIPQNTTAGSYTLKTYYLSNGTEFYASYEGRTILINDSLNLTNVSFTSYAQNKLASNYFFVNDSITATGNVYDVHNAAISSAQVNVSLIGTTVENTTNVSTGALGFYTAPFSWTSAVSTVGTKTMQVIAAYNNNTGRKNDTIYITRYIADNISVTLDKYHNGAHENRTIYNLWEKPQVTVTVRDPTGGINYVYKAPVSLYLNGAVAAANSSETGINGVATMSFTPSATSSYTLNVSASSPLNTTKIVYNSTESINVMWLESGEGYFIASQSPSSAIAGSPVTFSGNLTLSYTGANESLITAPTLAYQIKTGGSDVTNISSCSGTVSSWAGRKFNISCTPPLAGSYQLVMQAKLTYDGVDIKTNDTYSFSVGTNTTTPPSSGSSGSGTSSSLAGKSCTTNTNCSSGDYCSNNVCTAITCTDGAIINHACVPNKKVNVTLQSQIIEVEQGKWGIANFTLSNNGFVGFSGVTFTLYLPQTTSWTNWYSFVSPAPATLAAGVERIVSANISVPENASIDQYSIKAKVTTKEGATDEKTFTLRVSPSARNKDLVKVGIAEMNSTIDALEKDVLEIMGGAPDDERQIAERKLDDIRALYIEAQAAISKGNYFEAYTKQKEMSDVISGLRVILADKKANDSQAASRRNMIAGVAIIIAAIAGGFYYLWVPAPSGYSPGRGYSYNSGGKKNRDLDGIVDEVKKKIADILSKLKRQDAVVSRKYDYLKPPAKRW